QVDNVVVELVGKVADVGKLRDNADALAHQDLGAVAVEDGHALAGQVLNAGNAAILEEDVGGAEWQDASSFPGAIAHGRCQLRVCRKLDHHTQAIVVVQSANGINAAAKGHELTRLDAGHHQAVTQAGLEILRSNALIGERAKFNLLTPASGGNAIVRHQFPQFALRADQAKHADRLRIG